MVHARQDRHAILKVGDVIAEGGYTLYQKRRNFALAAPPVDELQRAPLVAKIEIGPEPHESMVIATPFKENEGFRSRR